MAQGTTTVISGQQRSILIGGDQHRLSAQSLDGMQGVRGSNPLSSTRHNASSPSALGAVARDLPENAVVAARTLYALSP